VGETRIFSERIVTPDGLVSGEVILHGALVSAIDPKASASPGALDWGADMLTPGLVDLHTDNFEKHYQPRPGAFWDAYGAALAQDGQCAAAGITTVFDSLALHGKKDGLDRKDALKPMISAMDRAGADGVLRAEHLLHLRCEVTDPQLLENLEPFVDHPRLRLLSVMDHTPGQRQIANPERMKERLAASGRTEAEIEELLYDRGLRRDPAAAHSNRRSVVGFAREYGLPLAAHDDATDEHVAEAHADGCAIAEFPVTLEAARLARGYGMWIVMGGPNFVRGGSHSGNLSAREAAGADLLDIIASDYVPLSMLRTAFILMDDFGWPPQKALAVAARNPARSVGLDDRGEIAPGQRADLVRVRRTPEGWPAPMEVWREGRRVA
jgi:alpha-D-ribose 1-methylphosphonate 5-triphosphate diphosphatase